MKGKITTVTVKKPSKTDKTAKLFRDSLKDLSSSQLHIEMARTAVDIDLLLRRQQQLADEMRAVKVQLATATIKSDVIVALIDIRR